MKITLPFGKTSLTAVLPNEIPMDVIEAPHTPAAPDPLRVVRAALQNPLGGWDWGAVAGARSVAIAVNDKTRPVPHQHLLPPLLDQLASLGITDEQITLFIAVGTHPPMEKAEFEGILPIEILCRFKVISHDSENPANLVFLGETRRGTPVWANRAYVKADLKMVVGNIEPHQFVGFSGGVKTAAIGLSGLETINRNHALMTHPDSQLGEYETNPARQDVEEIGEKIGVHFALNAILNQEKQIVQALAGDPRAVMQTGIPHSRQISQVAVPRLHDVVISSPGGHPKDINVYQSQKGLAHATRITRPGGSVILVAACPEGSGSPHYEEWALGKRSYAEVMAQFRAEGFRIGPHKAYQIARDASQVQLQFVSEMGENLARALLLNPVADLQTALDQALAALPPGGWVGVLPHAASTIPYFTTKTPSL